MGNLPKFRFYLKSDATHYYHGDIKTGTVTNDTIATPIEIPDGWLQSKLSWTRNMTYYGLFRALQTPYIFVRDGALIARSLYYTQGAAANCIIQVQIRDDGGGVWLNGDWTYYDFFVGNLDFANAKDTLTGFSTPVLQGGLSDIFTANKDTDYQFYINDGILPSFDLAFTGITLNASYSYLTIFWTGLSLTSVSQYYLGVGSSGDNSSSYQVGVDGAEGVGDIAVAPLAQIMTVSSEFKPVFTFNIPIDLTITTNSGSLNLGAIIYKSDGTIRREQIIWQDIIRTPGSYSVVATGNFIDVFPDPAEPGDRIALFTSILPAASLIVDYSQTIDANASITMNALFVLPVSSGYALRYIDVYKKMVNLMTTPPGTFTPLYNGISSFLATNTLSTRNVDNIPYKTAIISADGIALTGIDGKITMRISDLFKDATGRWMLGLGIDNSNNLILEELETFFDNTTQIFDLSIYGDVSDFTFEPASDFLYNIFKCGQQNETYDGINGQDEVNTNLTFQLPLTLSSIAKTFDITSPFRRDMYGIENIRYNIQQQQIGTQSTQDTSTSSDNFIIAIDDSVGIETAHPTGTLSGFVYDNSSATKYNIELSSKRDLIRNGSLLHSILDLLETQSIGFTGGVKNTGLQSNLSYGNIIEDADVLISTLNPKLFRPIYFSFKSQSPRNMSAIMSSNPYGYFRFTVLLNNVSISLRGFAIDVGITPGNDDVYEYKLLCCPDVDLTTLIR